jgi:hypothetical protein
MTGIRNALSGRAFCVDETIAAILFAMETVIKRLVQWNPDFIVPRRTRIRVAY